MKERFRISASHLAGAIALLHNVRALSVPILTENFRRDLLEEARQYPLRKIHNFVGSGNDRVEQQMYLQNQLDTNGHFAQLSSAFQALFDKATYNRQWFDAPVVFNDWMVQKYTTDCVGITAHRDRTDYRHLICLFVLSGHGQFFISSERQRTDQMEIANLPGDVILMPGPGFVGLDARAFHCVENITEERWVFGLRHDESKL